MNCEFGTRFSAKLQDFLRHHFAFFQLSFGQKNKGRLVSAESICMSLQSPLPFACQAARFFSLGIFLVLAVKVSAQTNYYATNGIEYAILTPLPVIGVYPDVSLNLRRGGFLVYGKDNATVNGAEPPPHAWIPPCPRRRGPANR